EPHRLSGGQKQRVAIARVLAVSPQVIILDEAIAMLYLKGRSEIMKTEANVRGKHRLSLITITHELKEVEEQEHIMVINTGEIWKESTAREIFTEYESLQKIGLDVPFIAHLSEELKQLNISMPTEPLNHEELLEDLWILHSKM